MNQRSQQQFHNTRTHPGTSKSGDDVEILAMKRLIMSAWLLAVIPLAFAQAKVETYQASIAKLRAAHSLSGKMDVFFPGQTAQTWKIRFLKPRLYEVLSPDQEFRFDGKRESQYLPDSKQYQFPEPSPAAEPPFTTGLNAFFEGAKTYEATDEKSVQLDGKTVTAVSLNDKSLTKPITLFINPQTQLPIGYDEPMESGVFQVRYRDLKINEAMQAASFAWTPPKDAKAMEATDYESKLIKPENAAPVLPENDLNGDPLNLAGEFKSNRATLMYIWVGPPPFPDEDALKQLYTQLHDQKFQIIGVDLSSSPDDARKALTASKLPFPVIVEDKNSQFAKAYGIDIIGEYLINSDGKVITSFLGHDPQALGSRLKVLGFRL